MFLFSDLKTEKKKRENFCQKKRNWPQPSSNPGQPITGPSSSRASPASSPAPGLPLFSLFSFPSDTDMWTPR